MPYKPVSLDQKHKSFETEGWYRLKVASDDDTRPQVGTSSGGYPQIKIIFLVDAGELEGAKVFYDLIIPPVAKAYKPTKNETTGETFPDRNKPTFWMLKIGWMLQVFGIDISHGDEVKNLKGLQNPKNLQTIAGKIIAKEAVGYIVPEKYNKTITDKETGEEKIVERTKGQLKELREPSYQPEGGFVDDTPRWTPPPTAKVSPMRIPGNKDDFANVSDDVTLDPDLDLEEDEDFFVD